MRIEPGATGWEAQTLPLCYVAPLTTNLPPNVLFNRQHQLCKILHQCFSDYSQQKLGSNSSRSFSNEMLSFYFFICLISERFYCVARFTICSFFSHQKMVGCRSEKFWFIWLPPFSSDPENAKTRIVPVFPKQKIREKSAPESESVEMMNMGECSGEWIQPITVLEF